jgi:uncharacterized protein YcnI
VTLRLPRAAAAAAAALVLAGATAAAASAHITVVPARAKPGQTATVAFRVVNERDAASTNRVQIFLPAGQPLATVTVKPHPGWTSQVLKTGAAVSEIDWTATRPHAAIGGETTQDFLVTLGPLPKADRIVFKALQTYSDGQIVRWIQEPTAEADRPAPALALSAAGRLPADKSGKSGSSSIAFAALAAALVVAMGAGLARGAVRRRRSS